MKIKIIDEIKEFFHKEHKHLHKPRIFGKISNSTNNLINFIRKSLKSKSHSKTSNLPTNADPHATKTIEPAKKVDMQKIREKTFEGVYDSQLSKVQNLYKHILKEIQPDEQKMKIARISPEKLSFSEKLGLCDTTKKRMILEELQNYKIEFQVLDTNFDKCSDAFKEEHEPEMVQLARPLSALNQETVTDKEDLTEYEDFNMAYGRAFYILNEIKQDISNSNGSPSEEKKTGIAMKIIFLDDQMKTVEQRHSVLPGWVKVDDEVLRNLRDLREAVTEIKQTVNDLKSESK